MVNQELKVQKTRPKRARVNFTIRQLEAFETVFQQTQYPDVTVLETLADRVELPVEKLCTWFQNRRSKFRKESKKGHIMWMRQQLFSDATNDAKTPKSAASSVLASSTSTAGLKLVDTTAGSTVWPSRMSYNTQYRPVTQSVNSKLPERYLQPATPSELDVTLDYLNIPPITASYLEELQNEDEQVDQSLTSMCFPSYNSYPYSAWSGETACQQTRSSCMYSRSTDSESSDTQPPTSGYPTPLFLPADSQSCSGKLTSTISANQASCSEIQSSNFFTNNSTSDPQTQVKCHSPAASMTVEFVKNSAYASSKSPDETNSYSSKTSAASNMVNAIIEPLTIDVACFRSEPSSEADSANYSDEGSNSSFEKVNSSSTSSSSPTLNKSYCTLPSPTKETASYCATSPGEPCMSYSVNTATYRESYYSNLQIPRCTVPYSYEPTTGNIPNIPVGSMYYMYPTGPGAYAAYQ